MRCGIFSPVAECSCSHRRPAAQSVTSKYAEVLQTPLKLILRSASLNAVVLIFSWRTRARMAPVNNIAAPRLEFGYDAFASHATDPDGTLVRLVEAVLESFHGRRGLPPKYARELQLCVDGRDFVFPRRQGNTIVAIEPIVRAHQKKSRSLLVLSGYMSLGHPWINHEIKWWADERPDGPVYFALTHAVDPDPAVSDTYMPKALRDRSGLDNPVFFDLRGFYLQRDFLPLFRRRGYSGRETQLRSEAAGWKPVRPP
jgi:hypothetical protein